jgi:SNF2 family DNA or RNA helicase
LNLFQFAMEVKSPAFAALDLIDKREDLVFMEDRVRFSAVDLLRLMSSIAKPVSVEHDDQRAKIVRRLLSPAAAMGRLKGMVTSLREYQLKGVAWLRCLYETGLSGLLCDDMGLGKTHQAMALMAWLKERRKVKEPFLVVCPTTVLSHWVKKIREHSPGLKATAYHGDQRDLDAAIGGSEVLVTSYGVLRNDIGRLSAATFSLAVFDEIQNLKNRETLSYQAACAIQARMRTGLTGTPIENSLAA